MGSGKYTIKRGANTHTLHAGDCLDIVDHISSGSVDLIITDPPYNKGLNYGVFKDNMKDKEYLDYISTRIEKSINVLKSTGSLYIMTYPEIAAELYMLLKNKVKFRRWITWHYPTNIGHSRKNFTRSQRTILFYTKGDDYTFNRNEALAPYKNKTDRRVRQLIKNGSAGRMVYDTIYNEDMGQSKLDDILRFNLLKNVSKDREDGHPCQLPLNLLKLLIKVSSNENEMVLDPFAGTFTTSLAAAECNRSSIGVDLNVKYVKLGLKRFKTGEGLYEHNKRLHQK